MALFPWSLLRAGHGCRVRLWPSSLGECGGVSDGDLGKYLEGRPHGPGDTCLWRWPAALETVQAKEEAEAGTLQVPLVHWPPATLSLVPSREVLCMYVFVDFVMLGMERRASHMPGKPSSLSCIPSPRS